MNTDLKRQSLFFKQCFTVPVKLQWLSITVPSRVASDTKSVSDLRMGHQVTAVNTVAEWENQ